MKMKRLHLFLSLAFLFFLPGCDIIVGIFKAGFWSAVILIALIVTAGWWGYRKLRK